MPRLIKFVIFISIFLISFIFNFSNAGEVKKNKTDEELLKKTGGVVQGMSGSPILQNNMIVGAVTHVIVNDTKKGYGIFITTMLKEAEN